jgi:hypothetical protein
VADFHGERVFWVRGRPDYSIILMSHLVGKVNLNILDDIRGVRPAFNLVHQCFILRKMRLFEEMNTF